MLKPRLSSLPRPADLQKVTPSLVSDYLSLTKPRIIVLLLITALGGLFLAEQGIPSVSLIFWVLLGGSLGAGGANAINQYLDRDIDEKMYRTRRRPLPGHRIEPRQALLFGVVLNIVAFAVLVTWVNLVSALLTLSATLFYVFVYTLWLKRSTPQNIVIGGAAGAVPPLVGWAAVTGTLALPAFYLFGIIFFWTPPHFWALSLLIKGDYGRAGVPMLPVVSSVDVTAKSIVLHSLLMVAVTVLFFSTEAVGLVYLGGATVLGGIFLFLAVRLLLNADTRRSRQLYLFSMLYLAALFVLIMVDSTLSSG